MIFRYAPNDKGSATLYANLADWADLGKVLPLPFGAGLGPFCCSWVLRYETARF